MGKKLNVVFVFHANQCFNGVIPYADKVCYKNLFEMFRKHPSVKIVLHISGTLLHGLKYFNEERIASIKQGIDDGQFEILGSTYSQNVMYSCNSYDNDNQIKLHKEVISEYFGVEPKGFWNPERCWNQKYVDLIATNGYEYTLIEERFLREAGITEGLDQVRNTDGINSGSLKLFTDDLTHQLRVSEALNKGKFDELFQFYQSIYENGDDSDSSVICYAEDAEATGMWQVQNNESAASVIENLDTLLTMFEKTPWLRITTFSDYLKDNEISTHIESIPENQATWMIDSAQREGFADWFDFNKNYEGIVYYRELYKNISNKMSIIETKIPDEENSSVLKLFNLAKHIYAVYQYEFGCAFGSAGTEDTIYPMCNKGSANWECIREVLFVLEAIEHVRNYKEKFYHKDIDGDSITEMCVVRNNLFYVLSPVGGKIIHCYDLEKGVDIIGNPLYEDWQRKWKNNSSYIYDYNTKHFMDFDNEVRFKRKGFEDTIKVNRFYIGEETKIERLDFIEKWVLRNTMANTQMKEKFSNDVITYSYVHDGLHIDKVYDFSENSLLLTYVFQDMTHRKRKISLKSATGFSYDTIEMLYRGMKSLSSKVAEKGIVLKSDGNGLVKLKVLSDDLIDLKIEERKMILGNYYEFIASFILEKDSTIEISFSFDIDREM